MYFADDFLDHLVAQAVGTAATDLFANRLPDSPDTAVVVRQLGGKKSDKAFGVTIVARNPELQVIVRGATMAARNTLMDNIRAAADGREWTVSGRLYYSELSYEPVDMGQDENQRPEVSMVFRLVQR